MKRLKEIFPGSLWFSFPEQQYMLKKLGHIDNFPLGEFELMRFPNQEMHIKLLSTVKNHHCLVLGTIAPPETNIFSFLLLCHTLKKENALKVTAILPYLAYSRHDKSEPQKSHALALISQLFAGIGIDHIVTIDIHSFQAQSYFPMPLISVSPATIFASQIARLSTPELTFVAPDKGAITRVKAIAELAGIQREIVYLEKKRIEQGVIHSKLHGEVSRHAIIIDDILDTGGTLVSCCEKLIAAGVKKIDIMVTHGCFTGVQWKQLWKLSVNHIYCTDTVAVPANVDSSKVTVLSVSHLLVEAVNKRLLE